MVLTTIPMQSLPSWDDVRRGVGEIKAQNVSSPVFWRSFIALVLIFATSSFMNVAVFPSFDAIFTYARDISVIAGSASLLIIGVIAMFRPAVFGSHAVLATSVLALALGAGCLLGGFASASPVLLAVGACLVAVGRGIATVAAGLSVSRMTLAQASLCIALAFVGEYVLTVVAWIVPVWVGIACFLVFPALALASVWRWAMPAFDDAAESVSPAERAVTQPRTLLPLGSQLFVCLFLFHLAFGFSLRFGGMESSSIADMAGIIPVAVVAFYVLTVHRQFSTDVVARISILLVVAGFLIATLNSAASASMSSILLVSGSTSFDMVAWLVLVAVVSRNRLAGVTMFSWGYGVGGLGSVAGAMLGVAVDGIWGGNDVALSLVSGIIILIIVGYALLGMRTFSFTETVRSIALPIDADQAARAAVEESKDAGEDSLDMERRFSSRCDEIARAHGLSPRESEVFALLARGRDRAYIEKHLTVSRNTVKSHVKHIYAKLDIHSHQDLIDLVEKGLSEKQSE